MASNILRNAIANHFFRNSSQTPAATLYLGALTAVANEATGSVTEVSGNGHARQAVTFGAPSAGVITNSADVTFPVATTSNWGSITHYGIFDASSAGNLLEVCALSVAKTINVGDQLVAATGAVTVTIT